MLAIGVAPASRTRMAQLGAVAAAFLAASALLSIDTAWFSVGIILWFGLSFGLFGCALAVGGRVAPVLGWSIGPVSLAATAPGPTLLDL